MKKGFFLLSLIVLMFASCQKEIDDSVDDNNGNGSSGGWNTGSGNTGASIIGTWNFTVLNAQTQSTAEVDLSGTDEKTVSLSNYTTTNNAGTFVIDDSVMHVNGLTYTVSSTVKAYTYENGVLVDSADSPVNVTLPSTN
ncbi:MAG TPA: hypothetical protein VGG71_01325, partial [Chitinophagaceae bacterium]